MVSIITNAHCVCEFDDDNSPVITTRCKHNGHDIEKSSDDPVNQHTGRHWYLEGSKKNKDDNSIVVNFYPAKSRMKKNKGEEDWMKYAEDAYIITGKVENGKILKKYHGFYDIAIVRFRFKDGVYESMGLRPLVLPDR